MIQILFIATDMHYLKAFSHHLEQSMQKSLTAMSQQLLLVGAIIFLGFITLYWGGVELFFPLPYENEKLRFLMSLMGLGLLLSPFWPAQLKKYLPWYWLLTLIFVLSFFFAFSFLMSQASMISAMTLLCSVFVLVMLLDVYSLLFVLFIGWGLAFLAFFLLSPTPTLDAAHVEMAVVLTFVILAGSVFNYKKRLIAQQRLAGMSAAASMIAHELRTPLLSIKSGAQGMEKFLPRLMEGYQLALQHQLLEQKPIKKQAFLHLAEMSQSIGREVEFANTVIDMLLMNAGKENALAHCQLEPCSMAVCIESAIARYPFKSEKERQAVHFAGDFEFKGTLLLMQHVLFNLLKNALHAIADKTDGQIEIGVSQSQTHHILHFKDNGKGIPPRELSRLFDPFFTTKATGTGIGLSFCQQVMQCFGGTIHCDSQEGEYTEFQLKFPLMK